MADLIAILDHMRASSGSADTVGLSNDVILDFASRDPTLVQVKRRVRSGKKSSPVNIL